VNSTLTFFFPLSTSDCKEKARLQRPSLVCPEPTFCFFVVQTLLIPGRRGGLGPSTRNTAPRCSVLLPCCFAEHVSPTAAACGPAPSLSSSTPPTTSPQGVQAPWTLEAARLSCPFESSVSPVDLILLICGMLIEILDKLSPGPSSDCVSSFAPTP